MTIIDQALLRELVHYNPDTGLFTWLLRQPFWFSSDRACNSWNARHAGKPATVSTNAKGYVTISLFGKSYLAARLAFMYMDGSEPAQIDHINRVRNDNRWDNLRPADQTLNARNQKVRADNTSGVRGVHRRKSDGKYHAYIGVEGKLVTLGVFSTKEEAVVARTSAELHHGYI